MDNKRPRAVHWHGPLGITKSPHFFWLVETYCLRSRPLENCTHDPDEVTCKDCSNLIPIKRFDTDPGIREAEARARCKEVRS